jgi:hypothetical protein
VPALDSETVYSVYLEKTPPAAAPYTCGRFQGAFNLTVLSLPLPRASRLSKRHICKDSSATIRVRAPTRNATPLRLSHPIRRPSPASHQDSAAAPTHKNYGVVSFGTPVLIDGGGVRPHFVFGVDRRLTLNEPPAVISLPIIHGLVSFLPFNLTESM